MGQAVVSISARRIPVVFFENQRETIQPHWELVEQFHGEPKFVDNLDDLKNLLLEINGFGVLFVDEHMPDIYDLRDVDLPKVKTNSGDSVGLAVIKGLLPHLGLDGMPAFVLSGLAQSSDSKRQLEAASRSGRDVGFISKGDNSSFGNVSEKRMASLAKSRDDREFSAASAIVSEWASDDETLVASAFGFLSSSGPPWSGRAETIKADMSQDIRDRAILIIRIKEGLMSIFRTENIEREREWLKTPDRHLPDGNTPWNLIFGGSFHELAGAANLLGRIVG
jgi:hypothetical protein